MITVSKEYPNFIFTNEHNRTITYAINGESPMIGWSGKEISRFPTGLSDTIIGFCFFMLYNSKKHYSSVDISNSLEYLQLFDKIASIDSSILNKRVQINDYYYTYCTLKNFYDVFQKFGFKQTIKAYQNIQSNFVFFEDNLVDALTRELVKYKYAKYNLISLTDAKEIAGFEDEAKILNISFEKYIHLLDKMLGSDLAKLTNKSIIISLVRDYAVYCGKLNWKLETGDFIKNAAKAKATYEAMKAEIDDGFFKTNQTTRPLFFENEKYSIVIPQRRADCITEGTALNNCLGTWEWDMYLSTGRRNIVFVRKKEDINKPYIACDIDVTTGKIEQFLTYNNSHSIEDSAMEFKKTYQEYLNNIWVEG